YQYDARRQQGDGGGVFGDNQFTSTLSVNFHFPRIPRRTFFYAYRFCASMGLRGAADQLLMGVQARQPRCHVLCFVEA
ncbi:hypothetical protein, partial [Aeromonas caviae]|uniref:hypothetical protein n=1 Tax=Aeromonas caviae TaxID=648 RepID=UPI001F26AFC8